MNKSFNVFFQCHIYFNLICLILRNKNQCQYVPQNYASYYIEASTFIGISILYVLLSIPVIVKSESQT